VKIDNKWKFRPLGEIFNTTSGGTPSRSRKNFYHGDIVWLKSGELSDCQFLEDSEEHITQEAIDNSNAKVFPPDTVLIAMYGATTGRLGILRKPSATNQAVCAILPNQSYMSKVIFYYLLWKRQSLIDQGKGGAQPNINQRIIKQIEFPEIPRREQELIISNLETQFTRLDAVVESLKTIKQKLEVYRKSVLKAAFDGGIVAFDKGKKFPIKEVCEVNPKKNEVRELDLNMEVSFLPMSSVSEKGCVVDREERKLREVLNGFTYFREGDVLLAKITPCFENGKRALVKGLINGVGFGSTEFHVLRPGKDVCSEWIFYSITKDDFRNLAKSQMTGTAGQKRVPKRILEDYKIPVPGKTIQKRICQKIESRFSVIDKLEETVDSALFEADRLRKSILKSTFEAA